MVMEESDREGDNDRTNHTEKEEKEEEEEEKEEKDDTGNADNIFDSVVRLLEHAEDRIQRLLEEANKQGDSRSTTSTNAEEDTQMVELEPQQNQDSDFINEERALWKHGILLKLRDCASTISKAKQDLKEANGKMQGRNSKIMTEADRLSSRLEEQERRLRDVRKSAADADSRNRKEIESLRSKFQEAWRKANLHETDLSTARYEVERYRKQVSALLLEQDRLRDLVNATARNKETEMIELRDEVAALKARLWQVGEEKELAERSTRILTGVRANLQEQIKMLRSELGSEKAGNAEKKEQLVELAEQLERANGITKGYVGNLKEQLERLTNERDDLQEQVKNLENELHNVRSKLEEAERDTGIHKAASANKSHQLEEFRKLRVQLEEKLASMEQSKQATVEENQNNNQQIKRMQKDLESKQEEVANLKQENERNTDTISQLRMEIELLSEDKKVADGLRDKIEQLEMKAENAEEKRKELQDQNDYLEKLLTAIAIMFPIIAILDFVKYKSQPRSRL